MASKEVADMLLRVLDGTEEFHLVAGVVRDGGGNVTNHGNSRRSTIAAVKDFAIAVGDGRYLQKANNLSDVASAVTSRANLSVYSIAQVDALIAGAGGGGLWYAGHKPTVAILATKFKSVPATSDVTTADDADVGMMFDSVDNGQAAGAVFKCATQATPSDAANWTVTCRISPLLTQSSAIGFGMVLLENVGSGGGWPLMTLWGPGTFAGQFLQCREALADNSYQSDRFQRQIVDSNNPIWLRIRWVVASGLYFFDVSPDGKQWYNAGSQSKAALLFTSRATHIGLGFYMSGTSAIAGKNIASCDYWVVS